MAWLLDKRIFVAKTSRAKRMWVLRHENRRIQMGVAAMTKYSFQELAWSVGVPKVAREVLLQVPELIAKAVDEERESCAKVCDETRYQWYCPPEDGPAPNYYDNAAEDCAAAIRAKGNK